MIIKEAYNSWSETYDSDKNFTRDLDQMVTREYLADLQFDTIIEIGCGTGKNTSFFSQIGKTVHAIDLSEEMIKLAGEKLNSGNVTFHVADITQRWPFIDQSVEFVTCNLVLEHIDNLSFIFAEAYRTLADRGLFFISELHPFRQYQGKKAHFEENGKSFEIQAFVHNISDFINTAKNTGFILNEMKEWWHLQEENETPRIVSFIFKKQKR